MKKILIGIFVVLFFLVSVCFCLLLYSHQVQRFFLSRWIHAHSPTSELKFFDYKQYRGHLWDEITFQDLHLVLEQNKQMDEFDAPSLSVQNMGSLWRNEKKITMVVHQAKISTEKLKGDGIDATVGINAQKGRWTEFRGNLRLSQLDVDSYHVEGLFALLEGNTKQVYFKDIFARGYGGNISGGVLFKDFSMLSYDVVLELSDLDSKALHAINEEVFSKIDGKLEGKIRFSGKAEKISALKGDLHILPGGKLKASLLGQLANYLPQSTQKVDLLELLKTNGEIPVEKALAEIKNIGPQNLVVNISVGSQKLNLNLNEVVLEINLDAPLEIYLKNLKQLVR